jgi:glycerophosphoryl diester phosphodiesterase
MRGGPLLLGHRGARASRSVAENTLGSFALALEHGCDGFEFDLRLCGSGQAVVCHDAKIRGITVSRASEEQLQLPGLEQVLALYAGRAFLDIELKVPGLEAELLRALFQHPPQRGYVVSSFLPEIILAVNARNRSIPLGIISERRKQLNRWRDLPVQYVIPHYSLLSKDLVASLRAAGKILFTWTVNNKTSMLRLGEWGVDGIISDNTELLARTFRKASSP